ncbi:MAG: scramblase [Planctomycetes bacterium]|nr:scramblase [Planctomycetota bacterium]
MDKLGDVETLLVRQQKEWGEILTGFETRNRYVVTDAGGAELYFAAEESSLLGRWLLNTLRPFTIHVQAAGGQDVLRVKRPFRFYFHRVDVTDADAGRHLGSVERRFSLVRRIYAVLDDNGHEIFELFGPILHPWTFEVRREGRTLGKITKKWSGLLKEGFTDADNFGIAFPPDLEVVQKALLLGAVFLIDFVHFEKKQKK